MSTVADGGRVVCDRSRLPHHRHTLDLYPRAPRKPLRGYCGARGWIFRKVRRIDRIHRGEVLDVREEYRALHRALERAARELKHRLDVLERLTRLPRNSPLGELARSRHVADLTREKQQVPDPHRGREWHSRALSGAVQPLPVDRHPVLPKRAATRGHTSTSPRPPAALARNAGPAP